MTPEAIRAQCGLIFDTGLDGRLENFTIDLSQLPGVAERVVATMRESYPTLRIPPHARWRHFVINGQDRSREITDDLARAPLERARVRIELAITSVLLDAGAGDVWRYRDAKSGLLLGRSEGLAIASLDLFRSGAFSGITSAPLRANADALQQFSPTMLANAFQVSADNPLVGLEGRASLISRLGEVVADRPDFFGSHAPRLGHLADKFANMAQRGQLKATVILSALLDVFGPIWPGRISLAGRNLGDTWQHPAAIRDGAASGYVPFHKLSQWLAYSLFEPLEELGIEIIDREALTGLAEYRNGGLFIDGGVLKLRNPTMGSLPLSPGSACVVEWRALTICLLDRAAELVREMVGRNRVELPLASVLEGGTWATGRRMANALRANGGPPLTIISDGSVF
jgi:Protein of unknown function (DUF1688)